MKALVGYTGFVGSTLLEQTEFDDLYNSKNIEQIKGKTYDLIICAGAPAVKWKANQEPVEDLRNINYLIDQLKEVKAKRFVLISTVDVYSSPQDVNEDSYINNDDLEPYGKNRHYLENFIKANFENNLIIRLPGLFGKGLKKNFIFDLIHDNCLHLTHRESVFQFYDMGNLWDDIQVCMQDDIRLVNFAPEPISAREVAKECLGVEFENTTEKKPVYYDMRTIHSHIFNDQNIPYMYSKDQVITKLKKFMHIELEKRS